MARDPGTHLRPGEPTGSRRRCSPPGASLAEPTCPRHVDPKAACTTAEVYAMFAPEQTLCSRIAAAVRDIARKRQKSHSLTATIVPNLSGLDDSTVDSVPKPHRANVNSCPALLSLPPPLNAGIG